MAPVSYAQVLKNGHKGPEICKHAPLAPAIGGLKMPKEQQKMMLRSQNLEEKLTSEIMQFSDDRYSEVNTPRVNLKKAAEDLRTTLSTLYPDIKIWTTGSYAAGVDLPSSDLDFTVKVPSLGDATPGYKLDKMKEKMEKEQKAFKVVKRTGGKIPCLVLVHKATGVDVDITIDNEPPKRNTQLLAWYAEADNRFAPLCRAIKFWAAKTGVENSKKGRFNSFSICLMVIHFLQMVNVLPNLHAHFPELQKENVRVEEDGKKKRSLAKELNAPKKNKDSLGTLYLGFFAYYKDFDFMKNWISIKRGRVMKKMFDRQGAPVEVYPKGYFTVVEDPFLETPWNCAGTVRQDDIFDRIIEEFRRHHAWILKEKSIFYGDSIRREEIEKHGKARDMMDQGIINQKKAPTTEEESWIPDYHPSDFWGDTRLKGRRNGRIGVEPWPEVFYMPDF